MASYHPSLEQITTLYRQNISKFLFVSDASLKSQTTSTTTANLHHPNNNSTTSSWMGDAARSLSLRSATPPILANTHDLDNRKTNKSKLDNTTKHDGKKTNTADDGAGVDVAAIWTTTTTTLLLPSSSMNSWSGCICMACGTLLLPPPSKIDASNTIVEETEKGASNPLTMTTAQPPLLLPLNSHISLRPLKRDRTRRRRASRVKAKELHNRTLSLQRRGGGGGNSNNINSATLQIRNEAIQKEKMQRVASMYNLGDGRAKNCLVIKCTFCGMKKKRKGMEIKKSVVPPPSSSSPKSNGVQRSRRNETVNAKKKSTQLPPERRGVVDLARKRVEDIPSQIRDNTDFISLDSTRGKSGIAVGTDDRKRKQGGDDAIISPLLLGGKKKKKKKPETPKKGSDLMDFLSSLND